MTKHKGIRSPEDQADIEGGRIGEAGELFAELPATSEGSLQANHGDPDDAGTSTVGSDADETVEASKENAVVAASAEDGTSVIVTPASDDGKAVPGTTADTTDGGPARPGGGVSAADTGWVKETALGGDGGEHDDEEDPDAGQPFIAARQVTGEFLVPQSELIEWEHHPRRGSRLIGDHYSALVLTAAVPGALRAIVVIPKSDGRYAVKDGRFVLHAVRAAHPGNQDVQVRCVLFDGTEAEAVTSVCDEGLGAIGLTEMEKARALFSLKQTSGVSQTAIAERYPRLTVTKVNNMLRAARVWDTYPILFRVLQEPDRVGIDYGVKLFTTIRRMSADELRVLLDRGEDLEANGERFTPADALDVLRMPNALHVEAAEQSKWIEDGRQQGSEEGSDEEELEADPDPSAPATFSLDDPEEAPRTQDVFGHDDQPVGTAEELEDGSERLTLPAAMVVAAMSVGEREEAASAFIHRIRRHFGVDGAA